MSADRMMIDDEDDAAANAYAAISLQLQQFTSPKLGSLQPQQRSDSSSIGLDGYGDSDIYESKAQAVDTMEWMEQELKDVPTKEPLVKTPRRTPLLERAGTPVMFNSSSKKDLSDGFASVSDIVMEPVQTPGFNPVPRPKIASPRAISAPAALPTSSNNTNQSPFVYRRYHDTIFAYLKAKRSLAHRMDLEQQEQALASSAMTNEAIALAPAGLSSLSPQERRAELDYLAQLQQLCWSAPSPDNFLEGDCWLLLQSLRQLGTSALIWENDIISVGQYARAQSGFLEQLTAKAQDSSADILKQLASDQAPLVLQRRYVILQWIQTCLDQVRVEVKSKKTQASRSHPDDDAPSLVPEAVQQNLLEASLCYILAGRLDDAKEFARTTGQPWRAAAWGGGQPAGYDKKPNPITKTVEATPTGNPARFLWKRQVWKNGRKLTGAIGGSNSSKHTEGAICALLANDVSTCLSNPVMRNWSRAFGATWFSLWGRLEDETLHAHNNNRRNQRESLQYPGTQFQKQESEQLLATSQLSNVTDADAVQFLSSSPFPEIRGIGPYEQAMAAFCMGKSAILDFCRTETFQVASELNIDSDASLAHLRFLVHLTLFLDSLQVSTTPIVLDGITQQKNQVLFQYVRYLESRSELWHLVPLYVSLLPDAQLLSWFPTLLVRVQDDTERQSMLESMQGLFPHMLVSVLRRTVRLSLTSVGATDDSKCQAVQWLLYQDEHAGDALIYANLLLRNFFLNAQDVNMETAMAFVKDYLPEELERSAEAVTDDEDTDDEFRDKVGRAKIEYQAYLKYLNAYRTFGKWNDLLEATPTSVSESLANRKIDMSKLNASEQDIAKQHFVRDWVGHKKKYFQQILEAAEETRQVLYSVLTHEGGWLSLDDEDDAPVSDVEEHTRQKHIAEIQSRYLVLAVNLYHEVCEETASWMSRSLDDAIHLTRQQASGLLQEKSYQPDVWYQYALDLATLIAEDRHGIHKAIGHNDLQDILSKLGETAVAKVMCASA